jgi:hypothetical protein
LWSDGPLQAKSLCRLNDQSAPTVVLCDVDFGNLTDHDKRKLFVGLPRAQKRVDVVLSDTAARSLAGLSAMWCCILLAGCRARQGDSCTMRDQWTKMGQHGCGMGRFVCKLGSA